MAQKAYFWLLLFGNSSLGLFCGTAVSDNGWMDAAWNDLAFKTAHLNPFSTAVAIWGQPLKI